MSRDNGKLRLGALLATTLLAWPLAAAAEVATDGTLGRRVRLSGRDVEVGADLGQTRGRSQFHSFERFGVGRGGRVTFTGPDGGVGVPGRRRAGGVRGQPGGAGGARRRGALARRQGRDRRGWAGRPAE